MSAAANWINGLSGQYARCRGQLNASLGRDPIRPLPWAGRKSIRRDGTRRYPAAQPRNHTAIHPTAPAFAGRRYSVEFSNSASAKSKQTAAVDGAVKILKRAKLPVWKVARESRASLKIESGALSPGAFGLHPRRPTEADSPDRATGPTFVPHRREAN